MRIFQDLVDSFIEEFLSSDRLAAMLVQRKLKDMGVVVTDEQMEYIAATIRDTEGDVITFSLDDGEDSGTGSPDSDEEGAEATTLSFSDEEVDEFVEGLLARWSEALLEVTQTASESLLETLKESAPAMLRDHKSVRTAFERRLAHRWRKPVALLEMLIVIANEIGDSFNEVHRLEAAQQGDFAFDALTRLHARACQIANEILVLLKSGYADGAHARWRTLHEIAVVCMLISEVGEEIAEKYLLHQHVESYRAACQYQTHCHRLGYDPMSEDEFNEIKLSHDFLIERFGDSYKHQYGWASSVVNKKSPTFRDIEEAVNLDHFSPLYRMASHNVHANPKGIFFKLGLFADDQEILLAGASDMGLADPGGGAARSLAQATIALLSLRLDLDAAVMMSVMPPLMSEIENEFVKVHNLQENE